MRVWGTYYEMGYAQGALLADEIMDNLDMIRGAVGETMWSAIKLQMTATAFEPSADIEDEFSGIVDGVHSVNPGADITVADLKAFNTSGDWMYAVACRSHSCWGSMVSPPVKTLSTRRADVAFDISFMTKLHWLLVAYVPDDPAKTRWVNATTPGVVTVNTGVNEYGTIGSIHDYNTRATPATGSNIITRHAAARYVLTMNLPGDPALHLDAAYNTLRSPVAYRAFVNTFVNYYVPEGHGGVFTGETNQLPSYHYKRTPQPSYFGGEVLITANNWTDGTYAPSGAEFLHSYYASGGPKTLQSHWDVCMNNKPDNGLMLSVAYRDRADMTIWFEGLTTTGRSEKIESGWSDLVGPISTASGASGQQSVAFATKRSPVLYTLSGRRACMPALQHGRSSVTVRVDSDGRAALLPVLPVR
jgi:hypothetical protein